MDDWEGREASLVAGVAGAAAEALEALAGLVLENNRDYEFSKKLLLMASELGDTESMYYLGTIYLDTSPIKDRSHVLKWIKMAASKKYAPAIRTLGIFHSKGYGVKKNGVQAIELLQQAVNMKDAKAAEFLADIYMQGELTERDPLKAVQNLLKAIAGGSSKAMVVLADLYFKGDGIEKSKDRGFKLLEQAIRKGNSDAMVMMGSLFNDGVITVKNLDLALLLWHKSNSAHRPKQLAVRLAFGPIRPFLHLYAFEYF